MDLKPGNIAFLGILVVERLLLICRIHNYFSYRKAAITAYYPIGFMFAIFLVHAVLSVICGFYDSYYFLRFAGLAKRSEAFLPETPILSIDHLHG